MYHLGRRNTLKRSHENIERYDLSNDFRMLLDPSMTYSSAYFGDYYETLEMAQTAKIDRMLDLAGCRRAITFWRSAPAGGADPRRAARRAGDHDHPVGGTVCVCPGAHY